MEKCYETTVLFWITNFQYLFIVIAFSIGRPWKMPFYSNKSFTVALILLFATSILIQVSNWEFINNLFWVILRRRRRKKYYFEINIYIIVLKINFLSFLIYNHLFIQYMLDVKQPNGTVVSEMPRWWVWMLLAVSAVNGILTILFESYLIPFFTKIY